MIGKLMNKEEVNAALVLALSGTSMVMMANGPGPVSLRRIVSRVLSNPIPVRGATGTSSDAGPGPRLGSSKKTDDRERGRHAPEGGIRP